MITYIGKLGQASLRVEFLLDNAISHQHIISLNKSAPLLIVRAACTRFDDEIAVVLVYKFRRALAASARRNQVHDVH